jgi:radical SAM-linked protein
MTTAATLRFRFTKLGKVRFTSHRDVARMWERALRRAGVVVTYSEGFSPRPRLAFGLALPTCAESDGEYLDVRVEEEPPGGRELLCLRLSEALPDGLDVIAVDDLPAGAPSLQEVVDASTWDVELDGPTVAEAEAAVTAALAASELPVSRERKGKTRVDDLRPALLDVTVEGEADAPPVLHVTLATRPTSFRPEELVEALDPSWRASRMRRTNQWILDGSERREPVAAPAPSSRAEVRAS